MKGSIDQSWSEEEVQAELNGEMTKWMKVWMAFILLLTVSGLFGISYVVWLLLGHFGVLMAGVPL